MQRRNLLTLAMGLAVLSVGAGAARAEETVGLGGRTLFVLRADQDQNKSTQQRVADCYDNIRYVLSNPLLKAKDIQIRRNPDGTAKIVAHGHIIIPIGWQEARAQGSANPMSLARVWKAHLSEVMPQLRTLPIVPAQVAEAIEEYGE